eukprot:TRINITY_DN6865_c0_g1_i17.p4 TRINITY_DN6865_c0_g1~~TRINITY_DN6865_c0_g1_i17.p4  ORF type:complete len:117 (-),score=26.88 TRINITY_DN6865_c0_g1_i17:3893-4243(-)
MSVDAIPSTSTSEDVIPSTSTSTSSGPPKKKKKPKNGNKTNQDPSKKETSTPTELSKKKQQIVPATDNISKAINMIKSTIEDLQKKIGETNSQAARLLDGVFVILQTIFDLANHGY